MSESAPPATQPPPLLEAPSEEETALGFVNAALRCSGCGSPVEGGSLFCPTCGADLRAEEESEAEVELLTAGFRCENCGAVVACKPGLSGYQCAFCDSTYVVELPSQEQARVEPEFVVPFRIEREQALESFRAWCGQGMFTPGDLKAKAEAETIRGIYLPFWTFSMRADSEWSASIGEYWYKTVTETYTDSKGRVQTRTRVEQHTEWYPLSGRHHSYHYHFLVSASAGLPQGEAEAVKPFDLVALQRYRPEFLAGWLAESFSIERGEALETAKHACGDREGIRIAAFLPGDPHSDLNWRTSFSEISDDLVLLPFWIVAYSYKDQVYRFLLNAQTGKSTGTRPRSGWRIAALVVVILFALAAIAAGVFLASQGRP